MPQAILTKFIAPTTYRPTRYKATAQRGSITISEPIEDVSGHKAAALALLAKFRAEDEARHGPETSSWDRWTWIAGGLPSGDTAWVSYHVTPTPNMPDDIIEPTRATTAA